MWKKKTVSTTLPAAAHHNMVKLNRSHYNQQNCQSSKINFALLHSSADCNRSDLVLLCCSDRLCVRDRVSQTDRNSTALNGGTWTFWQTTIHAGTRTQTCSYFLANSVRQVWQSAEIFTYFITEKEPQQEVRVWLVSMTRLTPSGWKL